MRELVSRTGMRELTVRALLHSSARGGTGDGAAAELLVTQIDNPALRKLVRSGRAARRIEAGVTCRIGCAPFVVVVRGRPAGATASVGDD